MNQAPEPFKRCKNRECTRMFAPRSNKLFCSTRCKNKYHNDRSRDPQNPVVQRNKRLKHNDAVLLKLFVRPISSKVPKAILEYEDYDFNCFTGRTTNQATGVPIHWIYVFGLEKNKSEVETYTVHIAP